jgi:restriction system protein
MAKDATFWGIHAGKTGDAESLFEKDNVVALGWHEMADLSHLKTREDFKAAVAKTYPNKKPGAIPNNAGQLYRFVHELKSGDIVVFPLKRTREIWLGEVKGEYEYDPTLQPR